MGRDKALVELDGVAMVLHVAAALRAAGASEVFAVGGDAAALGALGLRVVADRFPGEGPLGAIITALRSAGIEDVVTAPCDMPWITASHVGGVVDALRNEIDVAHSEQHLFAAWRASALPELEAAFAGGERAPKRALAALRTVVVRLPAGQWSADVDAPSDLFVGHEWPREGHS